jgi:DnaJ-class molecular chaperone
MIITVQVLTPTNLTNDQRELLRALAKTLGDSSVEQGQKGFFDRIFGS